MNLRKFLLISLTIFLLSCFAPAQAKDPQFTKDKEAAAISVAEHWLQLVDAANVAQSWSDSAEAFQEAISLSKWANMLRTVRVPLGAVESRKFKSADYKTELPNVPKGEYFLIQYDTDFAHKKGSVETVTPMLDSDGKWKVSGYFIK